MLLRTYPITLKGVIQSHIMGCEHIQICPHLSGCLCEAAVAKYVGANLNSLCTSFSPPQPHLIVLYVYATLQQHHFLSLAPPQTPIHVLPRLHKCVYLCLSRQLLHNSNLSSSNGSTEDLFRDSIDSCDIDINEKVRICLLSFTCVRVFCLYIEL